MTLEEYMPRPTPGHCHLGGVESWVNQDDRWGQGLPVLTTPTQARPLQPSLHLPVQATSLLLLLPKSRPCPAAEISGSQLAMAHTRKYLKTYG